MAISIPQVPSTQLVQLFGVQLDRTGTTPANTDLRTCIFGQKTSAGSATALTPVLVTSKNDAVGKFGAGSQLALMYDAYRVNDPAGTIWCVPMADNGTTKAAGSITVSTGTATEAGTVFLRIAGQSVEVGVDVGDDQDAVAAAINTAIGDLPDLPVTSTVSTNVVTVTAKNAGTNGNAIDMRVNYGTGEKLPAGIALVLVQLTSGATDPTTSTFTSALAAVAAMDFATFVVHTPLDAYQDILEAELVSRWDASRGLMTYAFAGLDDTVGNLTTASADRDSAHTMLVGSYAMLEPDWQFAAAYAGAVVQSLKSHPAIPVVGLQVKGVHAPAVASRFTNTEANILGINGIATFAYDSADRVRVGVPVGTYKTDGNAAADTTFQFVNAAYQLAYFIRALKAMVSSNWASKILVDDASQVAAGSAVIDLDIAKAQTVALYRTLVADAIVQDVDGFIDGLVFERDGSNVNRINVYCPPELTNQLHVGAFLVRPFLRR